MKTIYGDAWMIGRLGCITSDLPQGNDLAGIKCHEAIHDCRTCNISINQLTNSDYNYVKNARFNQQTEERIKEIRSQYSKSGRNRLATEYGIVRPEAFDILK